jgi:hypothetical protein
MPATPTTPRLVFRNESQDAQFVLEAIHFWLHNFVPGLKTAAIARMDAGTRQTILPVSVQLFGLRSCLCWF